MENNVSSDSTSNETSSKSDYKNILIIFLVLIIVLFTSLGVLFNDFINDFLSNFLYSSGWFIGKTSDVITDAGRNNLDIVNGAVHNGSNLLIKASKKHNADIKLHDGANIQHYEDKVSHRDRDHNEPSPDNSTSPLQKPIVSGKSNWCLVGEYQGRRGCIEIGDSDKCMSGQVFPSQYTCLNPNFSQNVLPNMTTPMGIPPRIDLSMLPVKHSFEEQQHIENQISDPHH
jgi:hypothetical protein